MFSKKKESYQPSQENYDLALSELSGLRPIQILEDEAGIIENKKQTKKFWLGFLIKAMVVGVAIAAYIAHAMHKI